MIWLRLLTAMFVLLAPPAMGVSVSGAQRGEENHEHEVDEAVDFVDTRRPVLQAPPAPKARPAHRRPRAVFRAFRSRGRLQTSRRARPRARRRLLYHDDDDSDPDPA